MTTLDNVPRKNSTELAEIRTRGQIRILVNLQAHPEDDKEHTRGNVVERGQYILAVVRTTRRDTDSTNETRVVLKITVSKY